MTCAHRFSLNPLWVWFTLCLPVNAGALEYTVVDHIPAPGGAWDYSLIDQRSKRLYLAQGGVTALDLVARKVTPRLLTVGISHGLALLGDGRVAVDDAQTKTIIVFEGSSGNILSTIDTTDSNPVNGMHALDALILEPRTGLLAVINGESGLVLLIDIKMSRVAATLTVKGHPEFGAANGAGTIFLNVNHPHGSEIVAIDVAARHLTKHIPLPACKEATGLAFDEADQLILSVCDSGSLKVIDAQSARLVASLEVGHGSDAVMFDSNHRRAFVAAADSGTLSVVTVGGAKHAELLQTVAVPRGTRLGAVDMDSGRVYLPSARFGPPQPPNPYPAVIPGSFEILVVAPN